MGDELVSGVGGAVIGYLIGQSQQDELQKQMKERKGYLSNCSVKFPVEFFQEVSNSKILMSEAVFAYLYGLPNASQPTAIRCLELAIKEKYRQVEEKEHGGNLKSKIDWVAEELDTQADIHQSHRKIRNYIHEETIIEEPDALEGIRHSVKLINSCFPLKGTYSWQAACGHCGSNNSYNVEKESFILGDERVENCANCGNNITISFLP